MGNLGEILQKKIRQMGAERQVEAAGVVEAAQKEIAKYIPEEDFEVVSFNRGILKVKVKNSVVASEIQMINHKLKSNAIKSIKVC
jgi:hypothetical protein